MIKIFYRFGTNVTWKKEESPALDNMAFTWPVYDLDVVGNTLVTVSDCLRVFDLSKKTANVFGMLK